MRQYMRTYDNKYKRKWREKNKERVRQQALAAHVRHREKRREYNKLRGLRKKCEAVGIDLATYAQLVEKQGNRCLICREDPREQGTKYDRLTVDHDHKTNTFRGLLCCTCNSGLGFFKDNPRLLLAAVAYLRG